METMQLIPISKNFNIDTNKINTYASEYPPIEDVSQNLLLKNSKSPFIEANTKEVSMFHLKHECIIPVFSKDNEITISHPHFIETVWGAACKFFPHETILVPDIRVSHIVKGRIPEAISKPVNELLETDKTVYYERMAFCFEIPSIYRIIDGNRLNLSIGGVRALNHENLYSKKNVEKFKIFIGFKNLVCCNLCVSTDGYKSEIRVMDADALFKDATNLFQQYNMDTHLKLMSNLQHSYLSEHQFAQLIGKTKLYQSLPSRQKQSLPILEFGDTQINAVAKAYYQDENFKIGIDAEDISLWKVYNLFTGANKSSYIDNLLDRSLNATKFITGVNCALNGDSEYRWFIE